MKEERLLNEKLLSMLDCPNNEQQKEMPFINLNEMVFPKAEGS